MRSRARIGAAAVAVALAASACSFGEGVDLGVPEGDLLQAVIAGEPDQLDPHRTSSYFSFQVLENVYDTLVEPDENLEMQPSLAESWELSEDQLTWTFALREDVTFHDGSTFTADDVVFSYNRIIDEELSNAWRFAAVEDIVAVDDSTLEITVAQPTPNLLAALGAFKGMAIIPADSVEPGGLITEQVGTGPFRVASVAGGDSIVLAAFEDHWRGSPQIDGVSYSFAATGSTALAALRSGEADWTDSIPPQQLQMLRDDDAVVVGQSPSTDYWYLAMNQNREPWDDVRVRQAVAYAIDRESIVQATSYGTATENQLAIPQESSWYWEYEEYDYDPDQARELLAEAGVDNLSMDFLASSDYPQTITAAQIIADNLGDVGISVNILSPDFAAWLDDQNQGEFDILMMSWLGNVDPDDFYYSQHHSEGGSNPQGYSNPEVDELLDAGRTETDEDTRRELYGRAATIIADEASYIYLYNPSVLQVWTPQLEGYQTRADGAIRFRDAVLADD